ncbi:MFS transporter [Actinoplanes lobatus]|uniref:MFS family permease n=1 Tax=Actinoplanes lobatus TaxID=113568 RepID=A0A7W7HJS8_9ACTN|nr:MFS transporter [Actinoplanes lobatus]MBB4751851.1 MFS family permease [Actinoplanes lobatus]GGN97330.1 MFS transporter [Actinoplanes lobatus]GIE45671.1 MFS transporter [Actinoplanes lobatus]
MPADSGDLPAASVLAPPTTTSDPAVAVPDDLLLPSQRRKKHEGRLVAAYAVALLFGFGTNLAIAITAIPLKAQQIDPDGATGIVSLVSALGTLVALVTGPITGQLSDRTVARIGMRRPYVIAGSLVATLGYYLTSQAASGIALALGFCVAQLGGNLVLSALIASIADQFAPDRRGLISGVVGGAQTFGIVVVSVVLGALSPALTPMFLVPAVLAAAAGILFAVALPDRRLSRADRPPLTLGGIVTTFWVNPVKHRDYGFAWFSRFALFIGIAAINTYQVFFLIGQLNVDPAEIPARMAVASLVLAITSTAGALLAGKVSDRLDRRKPFVWASAVIFAGGLAGISVVDSFGTFLAGIAVLGFGQGIYLAVDLVLVTRVLPSTATMGKDLGVLNIASVLPGSLVPAAAPALLAIGSTGGESNFAALFLTAAAIAIVGALLILPVRKVR